MTTYIKKIIELIQSILQYQQANYTLLTEIRDLLANQQGKPDQ